MNSLTIKKTLLVLGLGGLTPFVSAQNPILVMTYNLDSLKGKFGQAVETKVRSVTVGATLAGEGYRVSAFLPYVRVEGPGRLVGGTVTADGSNVSKRNGIADMILTGTADLLGSQSVKGAYVGGTTLVKLPTGDEDEGLGTGEVDYGLQLDLGYRFGSTFALSANAGRMWYGSSDLVDLDDGNYYSVGTTLNVTPKLTVSLTGTERDRLRQDLDKRRERSFTSVYSLSDSFALQLTYLTGSGRSSPDSLLSVGLVTIHP